MVSEPPNSMYVVFKKRAVLLLKYLFDVRAGQQLLDWFAKTKKMFRHTPLPSRVPIHDPEDRRPVSCWHILTVALTVVSSAIACFLLVRSLTFYFHDDHILEECTIDWNAHFPCHYLSLWHKYHQPQGIFDTRYFIVAFSIMTVAVAANFLVRILYCNWSTY